MSNRKSLSGPYVIGCLAVSAVSVLGTLITGTLLHWPPVIGGMVVTLWATKALTSE